MKDVTHTVTKMLLEITKFVWPSLFSNVPQCLLVSAEAEIPGRNSSQQETQAGASVAILVNPALWL